MFGFLALGLSVVLVRGISLFLSQKWLEKATLEQLASASRREPGNARVFHHLGQRARAVGQNKQALEAFYQAAQLAPDDEAVWIDWAQMAAKVRGPLAAEAILLTFLQRYPRSPRIHLERAKAFLIPEDHGLAYERAAESVKVDPGFVEGWRLMGQEALALRRYSDAETAYREAIARDPQDWRSLTGLGRALLVQKRNDEAETRLRDSLRIAPEEPEAHLYLGLVLFDQARLPADFEAARRSLSEALRREDRLAEERRFETYFYLGQSYQREKRWAEALPYLQKALDMAPGSAPAQYSLVQVYRGLGDKTNAALALRRHQEIDAYNAQIKALIARIFDDPTNAELRLRLARLYTRHGAYVDAARTYRSMLARKVGVEIATKEMAELRRRYGSRPVPRP